MKRFVNVLNRVVKLVLQGHYKVLLVFTTLIVDTFSLENVRNILLAFHETDKKVLVW